MYPTGPDRADKRRALPDPLAAETWRPDSFYDRIAENRRLGLHTLCLLDIRVKEPSVEALCRGRKDYEPPRYMSIAEAAAQLLEVEAARAGGGALPMIVVGACCLAGCCMRHEPAPSLPLLQFVARRRYIHGRI